MSAPIPASPSIATSAANSYMPLSPPPIDATTSLCLKEATIHKPGLPYPKELPPDTKQPSVFLISPTDTATVELNPWQGMLEHKLSAYPVTIYNPQRDTSPHTTSERRADNQAFYSQVNWELAALRRAKVIAIYFAPGTSDPLPLLELGLYASSGKVVVWCPDGYSLQGSVEIVCRNYRVHLVNKLDQFMDVIVDRLGLKATPTSRSGLAIESS